jgi:hypothetical protein
MSIIVVIFGALAILGIMAKSKNSNWWEQTIPFLIIISGIIITISGNNLMHDAPSNNSWQTLIVGYINIIIGLVGIIIVEWITSSHNSSPINNALIRPFAGYLTIGVIIYMITLLSIYKDRLIKQHVAHEYAQYSRGFSILLTIQICLLLYSITDKTATGDQAKFIVGVIATLNLVLVGIMNIILKFFSTDG